MVALLLSISDSVLTARPLEPKVLTNLQLTMRASRLSLVPPLPCILSTGEPLLLVAPMLLNRQWLNSRSMAALVLVLLNGLVITSAIPPLLHLVLKFCTVTFFRCNVPCMSRNMPYSLIDPELLALTCGDMVVPVPLTVSSTGPSPSMTKFLAKLSPKGSLVELAGSSLPWIMRTCLLALGLS